jgi:hypothetical protein
MWSLVRTWSSSSKGGGGDRPTPSIEERRPSTPASIKDSQQPLHPIPPLHWPLGCQSIFGFCSKPKENLPPTGQTSKSKELGVGLSSCPFHHSPFVVDSPSPADDWLVGPVRAEKKLRSKGTFILFSAETGTWTERAVKSKWKGKGTVLP